MNPAFLPGMAGALVYGAADFLGGVASRRLPAVVVTVGSQAASVPVIIALAMLLPGQASPPQLLAGALAGCFGSSGVLLYYRALAVGPMGLVAPLSAVVAAMVPVAAEMIRGSSLGPLAWVGIVLALGAIVLASWGSQGPDGGSDGAPRRAGLVLGLLSGLGFGGFFVALDAAGDEAGFYPLVAARVAGLLLLLPLLLWTLRVPTRRSLPAGAGRRLTVLTVLATGLLDQAANVLFLLATRSGSLTVAGVLVSLYPVSVVLLAALFLRERLRPQVLVAAGCALTGSTLLALGA